MGYDDVILGHSATEKRFEVVEDTCTVRITNKVIGIYNEILDWR